MNIDDLYITVCFPLKMVDVVVETIGAERTAVRIIPSWLPMV